MAKVTIPTLKSSTFKGWAFVLIAGAVLTVLALIDRGGLDQLRSTADGSTACQLEVTTDQLNVRAGPSQNAELLQTLYRGDQIDGTRIITDGYRLLEDGRWAATQYLTPLPGTSCA